MTENNLPEFPAEVTEALVRININTYTYQTLKELHGLLVMFAKGMMVAKEADVPVPFDLVEESFESIFMGVNHIKEMLKLTQETDNNTMNEFKAKHGVERIILQDNPSEEKKVLEDPRVQKLQELLMETVEDCKNRIAGDILAAEFTKLFAEAGKDSNGPSAN